MLKKQWLATLFALLILIVSWFAGVQLALAAEGEFSLGSGISYSSGEYGGSASTQILTIPFVARYERDAWTLIAWVEGTAFYALAGAGGAAVPSLAELRAQVTGLLASLCGDDAGAA